MATETKKKTTAKKDPEEKEKKPVAKKKATATRAKKKEQTPVVEAEKVSSGSSYIYGLGRRKSSVARVRVIKNGKGLITISGRPMEEYFTTYELRNIVVDALKQTGLEGTVDVSALVEGGGLRGQAESVRLGISRALCELNPTFRKILRKVGYLTRDPREKERKKPGLRKARRAPQWSKR